VSNEWKVESLQRAVRGPIEASLDDCHNAIKLLDRELGEKASDSEAGKEVE